MPVVGKAGVISRFWRSAIAPRPAKPAIIIAQVEGSGTAGGLTGISIVKVSASTPVPHL
jgi:hypothetical protein